MPNGSTARLPTQHTDDTAQALIGRDAEVDALRGALDLALAGMRQVVLLAGEPGIGKTRTAMQLADLAGERGALVLWGQCYAWEGAPAYWPWTQVLRGWLHDADDAAIDAALKPHAAALTQILSDLTERYPDITAPPPLDPEAKRFHLLAAIAAVLRAAAERRALVIVLDDVHWADTPSFELLLFLAQEIRDARLLFVATYRDAELSRPHPGAAVLADLDRLPHCRRLLLRGLPRAQVARLMALITGRAQSPALVEAVFAETDGNPFFVTEVVRVLDEEGQLDHGGNPAFRGARVPASVREAIGRRLDRLPASTTTLLTLASIIGRDFDVRVLARVADQPALDLLNTLDQAVRAQLIQPAEAQGSFRFGHALVQETLYQEASSAQRAQGHLAVVRALEAERVHDPPWAELAHHIYQAAPLAMPEQVETYAARAGDLAMTQFAWESAATHYQRALAGLDQQSDAEPIRRCDLLLALGEAQNRSGSGAGDAPDARVSFFHAFEIARLHGDGERMARAALGFVGINMSAAFGGARQAALLEQALEALDPTDSPLRGRVLARLAGELWLRSPDGRDRSLALAEEAFAIARRMDDPTLVTYALWARHVCGHTPDNLHQRQVAAIDLVAAAEDSDDPIAVAWGYILQLLNCVEAADLFGAGRAMAWLRQFDARARIPYVAQRVAACDAMLALLTGDYPTAEVQVERARALWQSAAPRQHAVQSLLLQRDLSRRDELDEEVQLPDRLHPWRQAARAHRLALALERGHEAAARSDYDMLVADDFASVRLDQHWFATLAPLAEAAVAFGDVARAARLHALLEPYAERLMVDGSLVICHGPVALYLGQLAGVLDRWEDALRWLEQARVICERTGLRPYLARTLLATADVVVRRDGPGDRTLARSLAERAADAASAIGMYGLVGRATALLTALPATGSVLGLTPRELDVLRLVARGLSDADIAGQLFVSPRTVGTHLTSIYGKLGVTSRTAAARVAIEHELS
jgi:DNA-binding CsgD family transcriptional regulator